LPFVFVPLFVAGSFTTASEGKLQTKKTERNKQISFVCCFLSSSTPLFYHNPTNISMIKQKPPVAYSGASALAFCPAAALSS